MNTILSFLLGALSAILIERYLIRYKLKRETIHKELSEILEICRLASNDINNKKPCLYVKKKVEHGYDYEPEDILHQKLRFPIVKNKKLIKLLDGFLNIVDSYRNAFTGGNGAIPMSAERFSEGEDYSPSPSSGFNLRMTEDEINRELNEAKDKVNRLFKEIEKIISKLL